MICCDVKSECGTMVTVWALLSQRGGVWNRIVMTRVSNSTKSSTKFESWVKFLQISTFRKIFHQISNT